MKIIHLTETNSTQDVVREYIDNNAPMPYVVMADRQTHGRGRLNRQWESPVGTGLLMSLPLPIEAIPLETIGQLSFVVALALQEVLDHMDVQIALKWPNDLMMGGKKLGGILIEIHKDAAIVGIGLNLKRHDNALPTAAYLDDVCDSTKDRQHFAEIIYDHVAKWFIYWRSSGFEAIRTQWLQHAYNLNAYVTLTDGRSGVFKGLTPEGDAIVL